jgi:hypothetical protein
MSDQESPTPPPQWQPVPAASMQAPPGRQASSGAQPTVGYQFPPGTEPPAGYQLPPGYELKKKKRFYKRVWFWLLIIFVAIIAIVIGSIAGAANDAVNSKHTVAYKITGTSTADITYSSYDAGSNTTKSVTVNGARLPWTQTVQVKGSLSGFVVTASPADITKPAALECSLSVDGKVVSTDTGGSSIVSCSGSGYSGK